MINSTNWEVEFENKVSEWFDCDEVIGRKVDTKAMIAFISSLLKQERNCLIEKVEKLYKNLQFELPSDMEFGRQRVIDSRFSYNEALSDILSVIKKKI